LELDFHIRVLRRFQIHGLPSLKMPPKSRRSWGRRYG
jgi:hypothetical protein